MTTREFRLEPQIAGGVLSRPLSDRIYEGIERRLAIKSPADAVPDWWVPVVLATMARLRCGPDRAALAIELEQRQAGCPLDEKAREALNQAVTAIDVEWSPAAKPRTSA